MVDNRGINPVAGGYFKSDNASANKMSEEKNGQGGEYFAQQMQEEDEQNTQQTPFQDRSAQLRASLDSLAMANFSQIKFIKNKMEKSEKEEKSEKKYKNKLKQKILPKEEEPLEN